MPLFCLVTANIAAIVKVLFETCSKLQIWTVHATSRVWFVKYMATEVVMQTHCTWGTKLLCWMTKTYSSWNCYWSFCAELLFEFPLILTKIWDPWLLLLKSATWNPNLCVWNFIASLAPHLSFHLTVTACFLKLFWQRNRVSKFGWVVDRPI